MTINNPHSTVPPHIRLRAGTFRQGFTIRQGIPIDVTSGEYMEKRADAIRLKHTAIDLAKGTNTAPEVVENFKKNITERNFHEAFQVPFAKNQAERDAFTKICNDVRPENAMPKKGDQQVYQDLIDNPKALKDLKIQYVQAAEALVALTSPKKPESDAAFQRLATRFRLEPNIDPNKAITTLLETRETANRKGRLGSLIGNK